MYGRGNNNVTYSKVEDWVPHPGPASTQEVIPSPHWELCTCLYLSILVYIEVYPLLKCRKYTRINSWYKLVSSSKSYLNIQHFCVSVYCDMPEFIEHTTFLYECLLWHAWVYWTYNISVRVSTVTCLSLYNTHSKFCSLNKLSNFQFIVIFIIQEWKNEG